MKKFIYAIVALMTLATACTKEGSIIKPKRVIFNIQIPEMQVRSNGSQATSLYFAFFDENGTYLEELSYGTPDDCIRDFSSGEPICIKLVEGRTYTAIFWAQSPKAPYTVDLSKSKNMTIDYSKISGNTNFNDAFYAHKTIAVTPSTTGGDIILKRPFAQLNIGVPATDIADAKAAGVDIKSVQVTIPSLPTTLDFTTGAVSGSQNATFAWANVGTSQSKINDTDYTILSTNYVLVGSETSPKALTNVTFEMSESAVASASTDITNISRSFESVPIQRNCRTYVLGNIISSSNDYIYTIKLGTSFDNEDNPIIN